MNEILKGYKKTKVGVIPEEWEVVKLNEKTSIQRGKFTPRPRNDPKYYNGTYPFIQTNEVVHSNGKIIKYTQTLNEQGLKVSKLFPKGTIIMTIAANIGFTGILQIDMTCPDSLVGIECKQDLDNEFLNFYFMYNQKKIDYLAEEAAQKNINLKTLNSLRIPFPPLKEQQKIAKILTTWDDSISKLEEFIKAKEQLKKGLMQKLLSGEVRFSGFSDEWEDIRLGDIGEFKTSSVDKKTYKNEKLIKLLNYMDIYRNKKIDNNYPNFTIVSASNTQIKTNNLLKGDVVFTPSSETPEDIGHSAVILEDLINTLHSYHVIRFRFSVEMDLNFKGYVFNNKKILKEFSKRATGSTRFTLSIKDFNDTVATLPTELKEQQKIAEVLSNADKEIDLLKNELKELKEQKKGLMQKLLTGKVRVKT
jgi:type I restriction enzyme S subunit